MIFLDGGAIDAHCFLKNVRYIGAPITPYTCLLQDAAVG